MTTSVSSSKDISLTLSNGTSIIAAQERFQVGDLVAVYGTLRKGHGNHNHTGLADKAELIGVGTTKGHMFSTGGFPAYLPNKEDTAVVELYRVTDESVGPRLDGLEGYTRGAPQGSMYIRTLVDVEVDGTPYWDVNIYAWALGVDRYPLVESGDWNEYTGRGEVNL